MYLNEAQFTPSDQFAKTREKLRKAFEGIVRLGAPELPLAAE